MEWIPFSHLINTKKSFIFGCLLQSENLAFARKITALPESGGLEPPVSVAHMPMNKVQVPLENGLFIGPIMTLTALM